MAEIVQDDISGVAEPALCMSRIS